MRSFFLNGMTRGLSDSEGILSYPEFFIYRYQGDKEKQLIQNLAVTPDHAFVDFGRLGTVYLVADHLAHGRDRALGVFGVVVPKARAHQRLGAMQVGVSDPNEDHRRRLFAGNLEAGA